MGRLLACACSLLLIVGGLLAFEAAATIKKVDAEKGVLVIHANGQDRTVKAAKDVKVLDMQGKDLPDGLKAKELKEGTAVTVTVERDGNEPTIKAIRLGGKPAPSDPPKEGGKASVNLKPLSEMTAQDKYKGEDGGLYGGGKNEPPAAHETAAKKETARIVPLDGDGKP